MRKDKRPKYKPHILFCKSSILSYKHFLLIPVLYVLKVYCLSYTKEFFREIKTKRPKASSNYLGLFSYFYISYIKNLLLGYHLLSISNIVRTKFYPSFTNNNFRVNVLIDLDARKIFCMHCKIYLYRMAYHTY